MPAYKTNEREFVHELTTGVTPLTIRFSEIFAHPEIAATHPHWQAFCVPGHLDELDAECLSILGPLGTDPKVVRHVDAEWPKDQKEFVRGNVMEAVLAGRRVSFYWALINGDDETKIECLEGETVITFLCSRANALAFLRGQGLKESAAAY